MRGYLAAAAVLLSAVTATAGEDPLTTPNRKNAHMVHEFSFDHDWTDRTLLLARDLGISLIRMEIDWSRVQPTENDCCAWGGNEGRWDYDYLMDRAQDAKIQLVLHSQRSPGWANGSDPEEGWEGPPDTDHMDDWAEFVTQLVDRYEPDGQFAQDHEWAEGARVLYGIESFQEPNLPSVWLVWDPQAVPPSSHPDRNGDFVPAREPDRWALLTNMTIEAARAADPGILGVSGAICLVCDDEWSDFLQQALDSTGVDDPALILPDAVGFNGYFEKGDQGDDPHEPDPAPIIDKLAGLLGKLRGKLVRAYGSVPGNDVPMWCMECGGGNTKCSLPSQNRQGNLVLAFWDENQALDYLQGQFNVTRTFWTAMLDHVPFDSVDDFGLGGLVFYPTKYPADPPQAGHASCGLPGEKKRAYDVMKNLTALPIPPLPPVRQEGLLRSLSTAAAPPGPTGAYDLCDPKSAIARACLSESSGACAVGRLEACSTATGIVNEADLAEGSGS